MTVSNDSLTNEEHAGQLVLVRLADGRWINANTMIVSVVGDKVTILKETVNESAYFVLNREDVKLKF